MIFGTFEMYAATFCISNHFLRAVNKKFFDKKMSNKNGRSKTLKYCQKIEFKTNVSKAHTVLFLQYMVTHAF